MESGNCGETSGDILGTLFCCSICKRFSCEEFSASSIQSVRDSSCQSVLKRYLTFTKSCCVTNIIVKCLYTLLEWNKNKRLLLPDMIASILYWNECLDFEGLQDHNHCILFMLFLFLRKLDDIRRMFKLCSISSEVWKR